MKKLSVISMSLFLISSSIIVFELSLMKSLSYLKFSHFSYLVISIALLGFCASGTVISLLRDFLLQVRERILTLLFIILTFTLSFCYILSWGLEPDSLFIFSTWGKLSSLFLYIILLFLPFFAAGMIAGTILFIYKEDSGLLYGMNLLGSGTGGGIALILMFIMVPADMPQGEYDLQIGILDLFTKEPKPSPCQRWFWDTDGLQSWQKVTKEMKRALNLPYIRLRKFPKEQVPIEVQVLMNQYIFRGRSE